MSWFYFICTPTCAGGFDVVGPSTGLIGAGSSPCLPLHPFYGRAREASVLHQMLSESADLCPRGASALEEDPIFELL